VRRDLRQRRDEKTAAGPTTVVGRGLRRCAHRIVLVRVHVVRGRSARSAAHLRHAATDDRVHGARHHRSRVQPRCRFQPDGLARRPRDVRGKAEQRGATGQRFGLATVQGARVQVHRTAQGVRSTRSRATVFGVRQQAFH